MKALYFISDLHLVDTRPDLTLLFQDFLHSITGSAEALYILGDFFATWTGPDTQQAFFESIMALFAPLQSQGTKVYFMPGNRDFLLNSSVLHPFQISVLQDPTLLFLNETTTVLLLHGDSLCTADKAYQCYRRFVRSPFIQRFFLCLPKAIRLSIARRLRANSKASFSTKPAAYQEVEPKTVHSFFKHYRCDFILHGHVHQEKRHDKRLVLGDWGPNRSILRWNGSQFDYLH